MQTYIETSLNVTAHPAAPRAGAVMAGKSGIDGGDKIDEGNVDTDREGTPEPHTQAAPKRTSLAGSLFNSLRDSGVILSTHGAAHFAARFFSR